MIKKQLLVLSLAGILPMSSIAAGTSSVEALPEFVNSVANAVKIQSQKLDSKQNLAAAARIPKVGAKNSMEGSSRRSGSTSTGKRGTSTSREYEVER